MRQTILVLVKDVVKRMCAVKESPANTCAQYWDRDYYRRTRRREDYEGMNFIESVSEIEASTMEIENAKCLSLVNFCMKTCIWNNQISGRFWEQYAEEIFSYVSKPENNKYFVIINQYAKVKLWRGTTSLTNSMFITRFTIEPDIHEVHEFKNRRKLKEGSIIHRSLLDESNHSLKSSELVFLHNHEAVQLKDIVLLQKEGYYVTYGTIKSIDCEHEWSYSSCYKCYDAVQKESDGSMSCLTCKVPILTVWPSKRYKFFVRVSNGVGQSTFVLFDSQV
ncbi:uncharacterized protein LOC130824141 [Amaranthus tricolor]|uniref:uncharacterized protein LOC130824141 n=1 Tax=Amaranthus tricolor TaxID=29722 RepID=UPI00258D5BBD|nr:uncharacterized protein LOC130824141 [Amaranthus tricolor]